MKISREKRSKKQKQSNTDTQWQALLENEAEANRYAAKCLSVCAGVGAGMAVQHPWHLYHPAHYHEHRYAFHHPVFPDTDAALPDYGRYTFMAEIRHCRLRHYQHLYPVKRHAQARRAGMGSADCPELPLLQPKSDQAYACGILGAFFRLHLCGHVHRGRGSESDDQ